MYSAPLTRAFRPFPRHTRALSRNRIEVEGGSRWPRKSSGFLAKPASSLLVFEDCDVLARCKNEVEVAPPHGRVSPPAVDHPPLLAHLEDAHLPDRGRHLAEPFAETASQSTAARADELGLSPDGLGQLPQLEP